MKEYTITEGQYDGYVVLARVQGPARPSIKSLFKEFDKTFHVVYKGKDEGYEGLSARIEYEFEAETRLRRLGYEGGSVGACFVDWLVKHKKFTILPRNEFHVPR